MIGQDGTLRDAAAVALLKHRYSPATIPGVVCAVEAALVFLACLLALRYWPSAEAEARAPATAFFLTIGYVALGQYGRLYSINAIMRPVSRADDVLIALGTTFLFFFSIILSLDVTEGYSLASVSLAAASSFGAALVWRICACQALSRLSKAGLIGRSMAVLGAGEQGRRFLRWMRGTNPYFINVVGVFAAGEGPGPRAVEGHALLGDVETLFSFARAGRIDDVVIALPWNADETLTAAVEQLKELPINVYLATDLAGFELAFRPAVGHLNALPMFEVVQRPISGWSSALKLAEDYVIAAIALVLLAPLMAVIALAIRLDTPGPVLFRQKRLGFNNEEFEVLKFRSMRHRAAPEARVAQATRGDPRVTRVGRVIRATSLDELPQLLNVLNGSMSLVGPRPHALDHNEEYGRAIRGYFARHKVKPGITGWAQVNGLRGETDTLEKMEKRITYDIYYAENWSLFFDIRILVMTVLVVFLQKNAY